MRGLTVHLLLASILLVSGCYKGTGDVLVQSDGTIVQGTLESMGSGRAVFDSGTAGYQGEGTIWLQGGRVLQGETAFSEGFFSSGSRRVPADSVLVIVWSGEPLETGTFTVDAASGWLNTGVPVEKGDMIAISARGEVVTETGRSGPDGQERYSSSVALAPGATSGQLVFKAGEQGMPVAAGSAWTGQAEGSGDLLLAVNVPSHGSMEPAGVYTVEIICGPGGREPGSAVFYPASR